MMVFWRQKLVVFAVPKTGTTALEAALSPHADIAFRNPPILKHMPVYRFRNFVQPLFDVVNGGHFEKVAVVREPLSWLDSWYRYRQRDAVMVAENSTKDVPFDDFVDGWLRGKRPPYSDVGSPHKFLTKQDGTSAVEHLFQYEQLPKAVAFLEDRLGKPLHLEAQNVSARAELTLDPKVREKLHRKAAKEFELWASAHRA
ncbi:MAG: gamma-glutamyl kinase [Shimia sp.]